MRIKKSSTNNQYIRAGDTWIRDYTKKNVTAIGITNLYSLNEHEQIILNETKNKNYTKISDETINMDNIVIVSDGFNFKWKHLCIAKFPKNVNILVINRALKNWKLMSNKLDPENRRSVNAYVINNPFQEAMSYFPSVENKYFPSCIASTRTNYNFLKNYLGNKYTYEPVPQRDFGVIKKEKYFIDDYRNPICAAIILAYRFNAKKIMMISCDDSFKEKKDFSEKLQNGLWTYPQHIKAQEIIDGNLFWLNYQEDREVKIADWSDGIKYKNALYINNEEDAINFFKEENILNDN